MTDGKSWRGFERSKGEEVGEGSVAEVLKVNRGGASGGEALVERVDRAAVGNAGCREGVRAAEVVVGFVETSCGAARPLVRKLTEG